MTPGWTNCAWAPGHAYWIIRPRPLLTLYLNSRIASKLVLVFATSLGLVYCQANREKKKLHYALTMHPTCIISYSSKDNLSLFLTKPELSCKILQKSLFTTCTLQKAINHWMQFNVSAEKLNSDILVRQESLIEINFMTSNRHHCKLSSLCGICIWWRQKCCSTSTWKDQEKKSARATSPPLPIN